VTLKHINIEATVVYAVCSRGR